MDNSFQWRYSSTNLSVFVLFVLFSSFLVEANSFDPYKVLGVERDATLSQIKQAYRELAKQAHPDKSNLDSKDSENQFIEINKAFQTLKDPEKRRIFDTHGISDSVSRNHGSNNKYEEFSYGGNTYRTFTFFSSPSGYLRKRTINSRQYYQDYKVASRNSLYFVFFYSDSCLACSIIEGTWNSIADSLERYKIGSFSINVNRDINLARDLSISRTPYIAILINGEIKPYIERELSKKKILSFIKNSIPNTLVPTLYSEERQDRFISSAKSNNRLSALIIGHQEDVNLIYLLLALRLSEYYKFGYISKKTCETASLSKVYGIDMNDIHSHKLLVFNENFSYPTSQIAIPHDNYIQELEDKLLEWPFIQIPKLNSQSKFDDLCLHDIPRKKQTDTKKKKLCVVLFTEDVPRFDSAREMLRMFMNLNNFAKNKKLIFSYLDPSRQKKFVSRLLADSGLSEDTDLRSRILLLIRQESHRASSTLLKNSWDPNNLDELDRAKIDLFDKIQNFIMGDLKLDKKIVLGGIEDEEGSGLMERIQARFLSILAKLYYHMASKESPVTLIMLFILMLFVALVLTPSNLKSMYSSSFEDFGSSQESHQAQTGKRSSDQIAEIDCLKLIELKAETYNGMVRLLRPGYRSIILLIDEDSRDCLLPIFKKNLWPFRRNKSLSFGYLILDKNLDWFISLLKLALSYDNEDEDFEVNMSNCIGTVLSLNGFKKYFRMYHAKHRDLAFTDDVINDSDENFEDGNMIQESSSDRKNDGSTMPKERLLDGFSLWLDRMFDGQTKKYSIDCWPDNLL